jgi:hypothetical protein
MCVPHHPSPNHIIYMLFLPPHAEIYIMCDASPSSAGAHRLRLDHIRHPEIHTFVTPHDSPPEHRLYASSRDHLI